MGFLRVFSWFTYFSFLFICFVGNHIDFRGLWCFCMGFRSQFCFFHVFRGFSSVFVGISSLPAVFMGLCDVVGLSSFLSRLRLFLVVLGWLSLAVACSLTRSVARLISAPSRARQFVGVLGPPSSIARRRPLARSAARSVDRAVARAPPLLHNLVVNSLTESVDFL